MRLLAAIEVVPAIRQEFDLHCALLIVMVSLFTGTDTRATGERRPLALATV